MYKYKLSIQFNINFLLLLLLFFYSVITLKLMSKAPTCTKNTCCRPPRTRARFARQLARRLAHHVAAVWPLWPPAPLRPPRAPSGTSVSSPFSSARACTIRKAICSSICATCLAPRPLTTTNSSSLCLSSPKRSIKTLAHLLLTLTTTQAAISSALVDTTPT